MENVEKKTSKIVNQERAEAIIKALIGVEKPSANFKQFIKHNEYNLLVYKESMCCIKFQKQNTTPIFASSHQRKFFRNFVWIAFSPERSYRHP